MGVHEFEPPSEGYSDNSLIIIFVSHPGLIPGVLARFRDVDDLYVMERVCAAVLGAITRRVSREDITASAHAIYRLILLRRETPPFNINLRDYARTVIEYAVWQGCLDGDIELEKCRPPYRSPWPLSDITQEELEKTAEEIGGKQILLSTHWGDFARYKIETRVQHLTRIPIDQPRPLNDEEREKAFLAELALWSNQKQEAFAQLKAAVDEKTASWHMEIDTEDNVSLHFSYSQEKTERVEACAAQFIALLTVSEKRTYEQLMLPVVLPDLIHHEDRHIQQFDDNIAKRWITKRAYDYG